MVKQNKQTKNDNNKKKQTCGKYTQLNPHNNKKEGTTDSSHNIDSSLKQ